MLTALTVFNSLKDKIARLFSSLKLKNREHPKGRKPFCTNVEAVTLAILKQQQNIGTKKSFFELVEPGCSYNTFVRTINRVGTNLTHIIGVVMQLLQKDAHTLKFTDSTDVPVCLYKNAGTHRTMERLSGFSETGKGKFYGLKLHLSADVEGRVLALKFTPGNSNDRAVFTKMNRMLRGLFVADAEYVGKDFTREFYQEGQRAVLTAVRSNMRKIATKWQIRILNLRMRIEIHFRMLKCIYGLVTSFPRSINGYIVHYLGAIAAHVLA